MPKGKGYPSRRPDKKLRKPKRTKTGGSVISPGQETRLRRAKRKTKIGSDVSKWGKGSPPPGYLK